MSHCSFFTSLQHSCSVFLSPRCPRGLHWCNWEEDWGRTCTLGASGIMRTIQAHLADDNISPTVGRQRVGHVMNYGNLDKHGLDLILSSETAPQKSPKLFRIITTGPVFCFQETPIYFSLKSRSPSAKRECTCCKRGLARRIKPQRRKIQTGRSQNQVGSTSMSNISKHEFYFWKGKTIPEIHPEVLRDCQTG